MSTQANDPEYVAAPIAAKDSLHVINRLEAALERRDELDQRETGRASH
jgi:hypothetical protein